MATEDDSAVKSAKDQRKADRAEAKAERKAAHEAAKAEAREARDRSQGGGQGCS